MELSFSIFGIIYFVAYIDVLFDPPGVQAFVRTPTPDEYETSPNHLEPVFSGKLNPCCEPSRNVVCIYLLPC